MIIFLALLMAFMLFAGCSTTSPIDAALDAEVANISNEDFKRQPVGPFSEKEDYYKDVAVEEDVLSRETLGKIQLYNLDKIDDVGDEMGNAAGHCYRGKYQEADRLFDAIYEKYREHPGYWNQIGICFFQRNDLRSAMLYFNKALSIKGSYAPAINNLGVLYIKKGKEQNAALAFEEAIKNHKYSRTPKFNLAQLYLKYGHVDKAHKLFMELYTFNGKDVDVLNAIANIHLLRGKNQEAKKYFEMIDAQMFKQPYIGINYAYTLKTLKFDDEAKEILQNVSVERGNKLYSYYMNVKRFVEKR
ncbi:MAG TPA: tetratricopeptide repeat protein [Bacteriovoracaceae bacterium]|nr:tetratricopeptide repeat protein [Bacteriovoracaceae bacterium]